MSVSQGSANRASNSASSDILKKIGVRPRFNFLGCFSYRGFCFLVFLLFFVFLVYIIICLSKTGLMSIPIFTGLFYHEPQPIEIVSSAQGFSLNNKIDSFNLTTGEANFTLTQEELTALVNESDSFTRAQIAVGELNSELFAQTKIFSHSAYITIKFIPKVKNDKLDFKIVSAKIGDLNLPLFLANFTKSIIVQFYTDQFKVLGNIKITHIQTKKGELILTTQPF